MELNNEFEDGGVRHSQGGGSCCHPYNAVTITDNVADNMMMVRQSQEGGPSHSYTTLTVAGEVNNGMMPSGLPNPISAGRGTPSISTTTKTIATHSDISALTDEITHHQVEPQFLPMDKDGIDDAHALRTYQVHAHHFSKEFPILNDKDVQPNPSLLCKWKNTLKTIFDFTRNSVTDAFLEYMQQLARTWNFLDQDRMPGKSVKDIQCLVLKSNDGQCTDDYLARVLRFLKIPMCQDLNWTTDSQNLRPELDFDIWSRENTKPN